MITKIHRLRLAAVMGALCSLTAGYLAIAQSPDPTTVEIRNFMFAPMSLTVTVGATVTWTNTDNEPHTVVSDTGLFRSGAIDTSEKFAYKFEKAGTYHFTCSIHPRMVGTIVVQ